MTSTALELTFGALAALGGVATAQPPDPLGPVRCYAYATDTERLSRGDAMRLCVGATSDAPARCYAEARSHLGAGSRDLVRLCAMATSTEPASCAARVEDSTQLSSASISRYCAAQQWPVVPAPAPGSPDCIKTATDRTALSERDALDLCRGSRDAGPVSCYEWGDENTTLSASDLVELCAAVIPYPWLAWRGW